MTDREAREWRECPKYVPQEYVRAKQNTNGEYEVLTGKRAVITVTAEVFNEHYCKAAQHQQAILLSNGRISHYEYV